MTLPRLITLGGLAALSFLRGAEAEIAVRLAPERGSLFLYEPFTLRLDVESDLPPELPVLPEVPDLAVTTVRRLPSDPTLRRHGFQFALIAERAGILTLPPFPVRADGETVFTSAVRLRIRAPRPADEMRLEIAVQPRALRVGQPADVTVRWTSDVPFPRCKQLLFELPLLTDPRCRLFPLDPPVPEAERVGLPVNNVRLFAEAAGDAEEGPALTLRFKLIPYAAGVLRTDPARILCALLDHDPPGGEPPSYFYNHFFQPAGESESFERVYLTAPIPEITVAGLPADGRDAHFAEIVGPCDLRASAAPADLVVGQAALFTVHLENLAFARQLTELPSAALAGLHPDFALSSEPIRETATDHSRSLTYTLRPLRPGIRRVPAVVIQTFDPAASAYRTLRSVPIPIRVKPDPDGPGPGVVPRVDAKPPVALNGIRHNSRDERTMLTLQHLLQFLGRTWWLFVPLPPLLWLSLRPLARRWERCRREPAYARALAARRRFLRAARRDEQLAWRNYLADRLSLCAEALTADTVARALRARNVDAALIAETRQRLEEHDAVDFGNRPAAGSPSVRGLVWRLHKASVPLVLVCGLAAPLRGGTEESTNQLFARALQIREEKPDAAQPLFAEAALRFESAGQFRNAGNSWFFAGETGRALANYRAAERRWPFDRQLRASIAFLRANRADALPPPAAPTGWIAAYWRRFGTWAAEYRVGLFVLAYLVGWLVFIGSQLAGRRVPRAVFALLLVAALAPLISLVHSSLRPREGVLIEDAVARLGPGYGYDPAFAEPLHRAAEFAWLETRQGWVRARLPDASEGWLRESDCVPVR